MTHININTSDSLFALHACIVEGFIEDTKFIPTAKITTEVNYDTVATRSFVGHLASRKSVCIDH